MFLSIGTRTPSVLPQVMCAFCIPEASTGRLRRAVSKILTKSSAPPRLPLHKNRALPTPSKSTLLQLLIPLHFISRRMNVHKKPGGGYPSSSPKVLQLVNTPSSPLFARHCSRNPNPLLLPAVSCQLSAVSSPATPFPVALGRRVNPNPFVCHSYKKHPGWGGVASLKREIFDPPCSLRNEQSEFRVSSFAFRFPLATRDFRVARELFTSQVWPSSAAQTLPSA